MMKNIKPPRIQSKVFINTAFAIIVMLSLFYAISSMETRNIISITALICLSTLYILLGVYGYQFILEEKDKKSSSAYVIIQTLIAMCMIILEKGAGNQALILLPLAAQTVFLFSDTWLYAINLVIFSSYVISQIIIIGSNITINDSFTFLAALIFVILFTQMVVDEESARIQAEKMASNLEIANLRLKEYAAKVEELAVEKERIRLAREIHDGVGHSLTTIYMQLQAAEALFKTDPLKAQKSLDTAKILSHEALSDVRNSVSELRDGDKLEINLLSRLKILAKNTTVAGMKCLLKYSGKPREIPPIANQTLYRVAQEGVSNALKHSQGKHIHISIDFSKSRLLRFSLVDDGIGSDLIKEGYGLIGMKERVLLMGGKFSIEARKNKGVQIVVEVPI